MGIEVTKMVNQHKKGVDQQSKEMQPSKRD